MHLVQMLLPLYDNAGAAFPSAHFRRVADELTERFGGVTAYTRAPAEGKWKEAHTVAHDEIVIVEVMAQDLDRAWWAAYRAELETRFAQDALIVRALAVECL